MAKRFVAICALLVGIMALAGCGGLTNSWGAIGPSDGETMLSMAADPHNSQLIYAGGSGGHVYSVTASASATPVAGQGLPVNANDGVNTLLPDPSTPGLVYAGTVYGFFVSTDYGRHWTARGTNLPADDSVEALAFGTSPSMIFAGTQAHGVYVSQDAGNTWQVASSGMPTGADVYTLFWQSSTHTLFAGLVGAGIYASTNDARGWATSDAGLPVTTDVFMLAALPASTSPSAAPMLFAGTAAGLYISQNGGQAWNAVPTSSGLPAGRVLAVATFTDEPATVYAGTDLTAYRSTDAGAHWSLVAPGLQTHVAGFAEASVKGSAPVLFAAAGQIVRTPSEAAGPSWFSIVLAVLLAGVLYFYLRRRQRILREIEHTQEERRSGHFPRPN